MVKQGLCAFMNVSDILEVAETNGITAQGYSKQSGHHFVLSFTCRSTKQWLNKVFVHSRTFLTFLKLP